MTNDDKALAKRGSWLVRVLFVLLVVHFVVVQTPWGARILRLGMPFRQRIGLRSSGGPGGAAPPMEKVFDREGRTYLYGGSHEHEHFDITNFRLDQRNLAFGVGREAFPSVIEPKFESVSAAAEWLQPEARVLVVKVDAEVKVYPLDLVSRHEVVNDVVGGRPIFATWCYISDLAAVYDRMYDDQVHTFGTAGYLYAEPEYWEGQQLFIFWDRETESLWWPGRGRAVSGPMLDTPLKLLDFECWAQSTWGRVQMRFPDAMVMAREQPFEPPKDWPKHQVAASEGGPGEAPADVPDGAIPPRWGGNSDMAGL